MIGLRGDHEYLQNPVSSIDHQRKTAHVLLEIRHYQKCQGNHPDYAYNAEPGVGYHLLVVLPLLIAATQLIDH